MDNIFLGIILKEKEAEYNKAVKASEQHIIYQQIKAIQKAMDYIQVPHEDYLKRIDQKMESFEIKLSNIETFISDTVPMKVTTYNENKII